jgi:hypothetical protein
MIIGSEQAQATDSLFTGQYDVALNRICPSYTVVELG